MKQSQLTDIAARIKAQPDWLIIGHEIPDGDCVGSILALFNALSMMGKNVEILLEDTIPQAYRFLCGSDNIKHPSDNINNLPKSVICLDCSDLDRVGDNVKMLIQSRDECINIDHHITNDYFGDMNYVDACAAATGEIICELLSFMEIDINIEIAEALLTSIIMDTNRFMNSNTTPKTLNRVALLLDKGVDINRIRVNLFESKTKLEVLLLRQALQNITISSDNKTAWMTLSFEEMANNGLLDCHPEGIIDYTRQIDGVEVGMLFREIQPGIIKIGFRSKGSVDVAVIAQQFGGGGHPQAAGARKCGSMNDVIFEVVNKVREVVLNCKAS